MDNFCFIMSFLAKQFFYCRILLMSIHFYVCFIDLILLNLCYDRGVPLVVPVVLLFFQTRLEVMNE
jgi:hypothetical protein